MLKLIGCLLIAAASVGIAVSMTTEMKEHLKMLYEIRQLLVDISNEAQYSMQPVEIILGHGLQIKNVKLKECCDQIASLLFAKQGAKGEEIWCSVFSENKKRLGLKEEETEIVKNAGKAFFGKSMEENKKNVLLYLERLDFIINSIRGEQREKQKVCQTLCIMCGLMLIILLI